MHGTWAGSPVPSAHGQRRVYVGAMGVLIVIDFQIDLRWAFLLLDDFSSNVVLCKIPDNIRLVRTSIWLQIEEK